MSRSENKTARRTRPVRFRLATERETIMASKNKQLTSANHDLSDPLRAVQSSASGKVKVAVTDIDGVLRGK